MTPILYEYNETSFTTNGIGRLSDATLSSILTENKKTNEGSLVFF